MNSKAYTDLEQSKKLAEILPIESADMSYHYFEPDLLPEGYCISFERVEDKTDIPCWSLAALLDILPLEVCLDKQTDGKDMYYYIVSCDARYCAVFSCRHINIVDACVEMIIKLKERNLI